MRNISFDRSTSPHPAIFSTSRPEESEAQYGCNGVGCINIVENRYTGFEFRGRYDSPAMSILRLAHLHLEGLVLDPVGNPDMRQTSQ